MKFLIIQENSRHEKNKNFRECFSMQRALQKIGEDCEIWGLGHTNFEQALDYNQFDVIINLENYDETGWVPDLSKVNKFKLLWAIDEHCRGPNVYQYEKQRGNYNAILHATLDYVEPSGIWLPNCYDDTIIQPRVVEKRADVGFCGNVVNRQNYLNFLQQHFNFVSDIFVIGDDMVNAVNSYHVHFNKNIANDINYRSFETIGCGIPLVTNFNPQYVELGFVDGVNCLFYRNFDELQIKITAILANNTLRSSIAQNGYDLSKKHTYEIRAKSLVKYIRTKI